MSNCKNCSKPIELKQGRRPREFCDNNQKCRNEWFRKNKKAKTDKSKCQNMVVFVEDENGLWIVGDRKGTFKWADSENTTEIKYLPATKESFDGRNNALQNAARGRDINGGNNDEMITIYEEELAGLGDGQFAKARKKWLTNKIKELKNN